VGRQLEADKAEHLTALSGRAYGRSQHGGLADRRRGARVDRRAGEARRRSGGSEELVVFDETAEEYFRDPQAVLDPKRRDEAVGFGLELALLTPYVLAVVTPVMKFLLESASEAVQSEAKGAITSAVRRLLRRDAPADTPAALSDEQLKSVRELAYTKARAVGVEEPKAAVIADAVIGSLVAV
jgi:hypothetical protein